MTDAPPLRVLVLAPHAFYIDRGTPIDVDLVLRALSDLGHTVEAVVYDEGEDRAYPNVTLHRIGAPPSLARIGPGFSAKKLRADRHLFRKARERVAAFRPDVIHAGEEAVFMAHWFRRRRGIPYVYDMDSSIAQQLVEKKPALRFLAPLFNRLEAGAVRGAAACAPVCPALADLARGHGARHVTTLHDISQLAEPDRRPTGFLRTDRRMPPGSVVFMYVGNLEPYQGVRLLLDGAAHAVDVALEAGTAPPPIQVVVAGGSDRHIAEHRQRAHDLGIQNRCHFLGRWPADRLDALLAEADVLVAPRTRGINTPQKVFPYLHTGRAVLLTDLPTHTQTFDERVAFFAAPEPAAFGDAMTRLAADSDARASRGAAARDFIAQNHTYPAHLARVRELYGHVAAHLRPA